MKTLTNTTKCNKSDGRHLAGMQHSCDNTALQQAAFISSNTQRNSGLVWLYYLLPVAICLSIAIPSHAQLMFQKTYGTTGAELGFNGIQTTDNGYLLLGSTNFMPGGSSGADIYAIKTNAQGDTVWTKTFGTNVSEFGYAVQQTSDNGYIICSGEKFRLLKLNATGDTLWTKYLLGGAKHVIETSDSGIVAIGTAGGGGVLGAYVVKWNKNGDHQWSKRFTGADDMLGNMIQQTNDGGFILIGTCDLTTALDTNIHMIKLNSNGVLQWSRIFGQSGFDNGIGVKQTADGGYILLGTTFSYATGANNSDILLLKTNYNGIPLWARRIGDSTHFEEAIDLLVHNDGGYTIAGLTGEQPNNILLLRTDSNGHTLWTKTYGGAGDNRIGSVCSTSDGGYLLCGYTNGFGIGSTDIVVFKTDQNGNSPCNASAVNLANDSIMVYASVQVTNTDSNTTFLTPVYNISSAGIVTTICISTSTIDRSGPASIATLSPNPLNTQTVLTFDYKQGHQYLINLLDVQGRKLKTITDITGGSMTISREQLQPGMYLVQLIQDGQSVASLKMLIE